MAKNTKKLPNGYWHNYENNHNEAKKYKSRKEFQKSCSGAYNAARKNGWLDNYSWFIEKKKWDEKTCYQEAKNYKSKSEFKKGCKSAYNAALKNGWLSNYTWFIEKKKPSGYWTEKTCYQEAQKYKSRREFEKGCSGAYKVALKNGWLDNYTWFISTDELLKIKLTKWTEKTCYQEAQKYKSRREFEKGCKSAYNAALKNGWLNNYTWFSVSKTGKKWDEKTCYQEAQKYKSRSELAKGCSGAYDVARKNGWLDDYFAKCN